MIGAPGRNRTHDLVVRSANSGVQAFDLVSGERLAREFSSLSFNVLANSRAMIPRSRRQLHLRCNRVPGHRDTTIGKPSDQSKIDKPADVGVNILVVAVEM